MQRMLWVAALGVGLAGCGVDGAERLEPVATTASAVRPTIYRTNWHGASAGVWTGDEHSSLGVSVYEHRSNRERTASLTYHRSSVDPASYRCDTIVLPCKCRVAPCDCPPGSYEYCRYTRSYWEYGYGTIPSRDFQAAGSKARLDSAFGPDFYGERCVYEDEVGSTCTNTVPSGRITLDWTRNGTYRAGSSGSNQHRAGRYFYKQTGSSESASASVTGSVLGIAIQSAQGDISRGHSVSVERTVAP